MLSPFPKRLAIFCLLSPLAIGCGLPGEPGVAVSGRVTHKGKPVEEGMITFRADFATGGRSAIGDIRGGRYSIPSEDGPSLGRFDVEIVGLTTDPVDASKLIVSKEISDAYNVETTLSVTFRRRDTIELSFDLP